LGTRIYDYIFMPVLDQNGDVEAIAGTTRDITDIKRAEDKYRQSEKSLRTMIDQTPAATLVLMGDDLVISQINPSMLQLIGHGEQVVGRPLLEVMPELEGQYIWGQVEKVYREGTSFDQTEVRVPHNRTGGIQDYYYNIAYRPLTDDGKIIGMIQVAVDVTEQVIARRKLEESENDLRNLLVQSPVGICLLDAATLVVEIVNDKFIEIAGKPYEAIVGKSYWEPFAEAEPYYADALQEVIRSGKAFYINEAEMMLIRHGKEEKIYVTFVYEPMKDPEGAVKKVVVWVLENTTQVKERLKVAESEMRYKELSASLERQVGDRTKELQRSNDDLQQFAHVASHDLKEPVRKIKMFTARLEDHFKGKLDEAAQRYMDRIHVATDRMFTMIDGVLMYSTLNGSKQEPEMVDLNEVIGSIEIDLEVMLQKTGGKIIIKNTLPTIEGARVLLHQLFYNLTNNAIKFARPGVQPQIKLSSSFQTNNQKPFVHIVLQDNGIGFSADDAERIFDTFVRLNAKDSFEGTGLGLSLCKKIVERHGGTITADGTLGEGAEFVIELPVELDGKGI
ncbi:MAG: PAS domain-containing sensor histidine kinase, partial [Flavobacterium sp.]